MGQLGFSRISQLPSPQPVYCNLRFGVNFSSSFTMECKQLKVALGHNESIGMVPTAGDLGTFGLCMALVFVNEKMANEDILKATLGKSW